MWNRLHRRLADLPLRRKLVLMTLAIALIATTVMVVFVEVQSSRAKRRDFVQYALAQTRLMAEYSAGPLVFEDQAGGREVLAKLTQDPQVLYLRLEDGAGRVFAESQRPDIGGPVRIPLLADDEPYRLEGEVLHVAMPVIQRKVVGRLRIGFTVAVLEYGLLHERGMLVLVLLGVALMSVFLAEILQQVVSKPLLALERHARHVAATHDYQTHLPPPSQDEVGGLYRAFNHLVDRIREREAEILQLNTSLEVRIAERTKALEESRNLLNAILECSPDGLLLMDNASKVLFHNRRLFELWGLGPVSEGLAEGDPIHQALDRLIDPAGFRSLQHHYLAEANRHLTGVDLIPFTDGTTLERHTAPLFDDSDRYHGRIWYYRDVTLHKRAEEALKSASLAKSEFLARMTHEIRTPLAAIIGISELALRAEPTPKQADYLTKVRLAAKSLLRIVNDVLDFSKLEADRMELEEVPFVLREVLDSVLAVNTPLAESKGLELVVEISPRVPPILVGDPLRLEQILSNLCGNAVKFTAAGRVSIEIGPARADGGQAASDRICLHFSVRDNGIGMSPEQTGKLFLAFSQAEPSTTRRFGGSGLGLVICQRLVTLMGGGIWMESALGVGSVFHFTANFTTASPDAVPTTTWLAELPEPMAGRLNGVRILVVEDSEIIQQILAEILDQAGAVVEIAQNGHEAVAAIDRAGGPGIDAVLMDVQMPEMDGLTATREIRALAAGRTLPILAMTAHAFPEERLRCLAAGMNDHLTKPVDSELLIRRLAEWTDARPAAIDFDDGLRRCGGKATLYHKLLATFSRRYETLADTLRQTLAAGDQDGARAMVHAVKGEAANLGAAELAKAAGTLERLLSSDPGGDPLPALAPLATTLEAVVAEVRKIIGDGDAPPDGDANFDLESGFAALGARLDHNDLTADDLWERLRRPFRAIHPAKAAEIDAAMEAMDYETARRLLPTPND